MPNVQVPLFSVRAYCNAMAVPGLPSVVGATTCELVRYALQSQAQALETATGTPLSQRSLRTLTESACQAVAHVTAADSAIGGPSFAGQRANSEALGAFDSAEALATAFSTAALAVRLSPQMAVHHISAQPHHIVHKVLLPVSFCKHERHVGFRMCTRACNGMQLL